MGVKQNAMMFKIKNYNFFSVVAWTNCWPGLCKWWLYCTHLTILTIFDSICLTMLQTFFSLLSQIFKKISALFSTSLFKWSLQWSIAWFTDPCEIKFQAWVVAGFKWSRLWVSSWYTFFCFFYTSSVSWWPRQSSPRVQIRTPWNTLNANLFSFS